MPYIKKANQKTSAKTRIIEFISRRFYENIYHECLKSMDDEDEVPDHVNEILIKCYTNMAKYDSCKSMLSTWVMNITRNYLADYKKSMQHKPELINCDSDFFDLYTSSNESRSESGNGCGQAKNKTSCLRRALKRLKNRSRLILMYRANDISYREISGMMNISEKAAMEAHRRAMKRLKKLFWEEMGVNSFSGSVS